MQPVGDKCMFGLRTDERCPHVAEFSFHGRHGYWQACAAHCVSDDKYMATGETAKAYFARVGIPAFEGERLGDLLRTYRYRYAKRKEKQNGNG